MEKVKSKVGKRHRAPHRQLPSQRVEINANIEESPLANFIWRTQPPMCGRVNLKVQMIHEILGRTSQSFQLDFKFISSHMDDHSVQMEAEKHNLSTNMSKKCLVWFQKISDVVYFLFSFSEIAWQVLREWCYLNFATAVRYQILKQWIHMEQYKI